MRRHGGLVGALLGAISGGWWIERTFRGRLVWTACGLPMITPSYNLLSYGIIGMAVFGAALAT